MGRYRFQMEINHDPRQGGRATGYSTDSLCRTTPAMATEKECVGILKPCGGIRKATGALQGAQESFGRCRYRESDYPRLTAFFWLSGGMGRGAGGYRGADY